MPKRWPERAPREPKPWVLHNVQRDGSDVFDRVTDVRLGRVFRNSDGWRGTDLAGVVLAGPFPHRGDAEEIVYERALGLEPRRLRQLARADRDALYEAVTSMVRWAEENRGARRAQPGQPGQLVFPCGAGLIHEVELLAAALNVPNMRGAFPEATALLQEARRFDAACRCCADAVLPARCLFAATECAAYEQGIGVEGRGGRARGRRAIGPAALVPTLHVLGHGIVTGYGLHWGSKFAGRHEARLGERLVATTASGRRSWWRR